jgi:hypothetical protein
MRAVYVITKSSTTAFCSEGPKRFVLAILLEAFIQPVMDVLCDMRLSSSVDEDTGLMGSDVQDLLDWQQSLSKFLNVF